MKGKELKLSYIRQTIEDLQRDYKTVEKDLKVELDGTTKNKLKDRLDMITKEIDTLEAEEKAIQQKLNQDVARSALTALMTLLKHHASHLSDMRTAYLSVLKNRAWQLPNHPTAPDEIINQLLRIPKSQFNYEALEEFAAHLVTNIQEADLISGLQRWGEQQLGEGWSGLLQQVIQQQAQQTLQTQPALLVLISRGDEASTQSQSETYYQIKAWLICDTQDYQAHRQGISSISIAGTTGDETYAQSDLSGELPKLVSQFLAESSHLVDNDPELQICLPLDLMNHDIDLWRLDDSDGPIKPPLGRRYKVVLRCTERWSRSYKQDKIWKQKWKQHQSLLEKTACDAFVAGDDDDLENLYYDLVEETVVGLKVIQAPTQVGANSLFGVLLQAGIPLAIWGRLNLKSTPNHIELDRVLKGCVLKNLLHIVKEERKEARKAALDAHIGHHLSLLWDNPHLLPPKSS